MVAGASTAEQYGAQAKLDLGLDLGETSMRHPIVAVLLILLVVTVMAGAGLYLFWVSLRGEAIQPLSGAAILEVDLARSYPEYVPEESLGVAIFGHELELRDVVAALRAAAADEEIVGVFARVGPTPVGMATLQELRDAIAEVRAAGKPTVAWADTLGEWGAANGAYYLASEFGEVYLQPSGDVGLTGVRWEVPFLRGALDKIGVEPLIGRRAEYKSAPETYTERGLTAAHEEMLSSLASSQFGQMVRGVAAGRDLGEEAVRSLVERGPFSAQEALEAGLIDDTLYLEECREAMSEALDGADWVELKDYAGSARLPRRGHGVALIYGVGSVERGESHYDPFTGGMGMGSETIAGAFRDAVEDPEIEAILFRVDSPGGSYVASDTIWRETVRAREAGKPVVVSMGDVAGSGGYFVAMAADAIVAQPGTLTGSIGVYSGKFVTREGWSKLGITWDEISTSAHAGIWSSLEPYGPEEWAKVEASLDRIYDDFVSKVAAGRELSEERVREIARGRVWTGEQALEIGLVDDLGGQVTAERHIRRELGLSETDALRLQVFPKPRTPWEVLRERRRWVATDLPRSLEPAVRLARSLGLLEGERGALAMPWVPEAP
jgi:protease-4